MRCLPTIALFWFVRPASCQSVTTVPNYGITSEGVLRSRALLVVRPAYPADSLRRGLGGAAVAEVIISTAGTVEHVSVLEAPSEPIAKSVADAVARWRFRPFSQTPTIVTAKLTFYFVLSATRGSVLDPSEAPYIGRWPVRRPRVKR